MAEQLPQIPPNISVVIPVYNGSATLPALVERLVAALDEMDRSFEIVLVNDGSSDRSWAVLGELRERYGRHIVAIDLMRNFGQHNALMCGLRASSGDWIVTMDDDLQNPPEEIPKLIAAIEEQDLDLVYGIASLKQHAPWRNLGSWITQVFYRRVFGLENSVSAFRIIRRLLVESIDTYSLNYTYLDGLFAWNSQRIGMVEVHHEARSEGRSGYTVKRLVVLALNLFSNFSLLPLQIISVFGFIVALFGFLIAGAFLVGYLFNVVTVPGFVSIILSVLIFGGIQLVALGVMGEYLGRLHMNVNKKPQYVQRHVLKN